MNNLKDHRSKIEDKPDPILKIPIHMVFTRKIVHLFPYQPDHCLIVNGKNHLLDFIAHLL